MAKIVLDFDGCVFSTAKRIVDLAKIHYPNSYKGGTWKNIKRHGFDPVLDLDEDSLQDLFNRKDFYVEGYLMDGAIDTIKKLQAEGHTVEMLSVGTSYNNANKALLFQKLGMSIVLTLITTVGTNNISFNKGTFTSNKKKNTVDKIISMFGSTSLGKFLRSKIKPLETAIYVDDRAQCLKTVNDFDYKIQMREEGYVLDSDRGHGYSYSTNWEDLDRKIHKLIGYGEE